MPELPEVEVNRQGLEKLVQGKVIEDLHVYWPKILVGYETDPHIYDGIYQKTILSVQRRAKYLLFELEDAFIVSHLRMEGKYFVYNPEEVPPFKDKHTHVIIRFTDQSELHYHDVRKFGRMEYVNKDEIQPFFEARKIGPEPTQKEFLFDDFLVALKQSKQVIKQALLSQKIVAGLGNIYVDEVLFQSRIHPETRANELKPKQVEKLHQAIIDTMADAIRLGGSTIRSYKNTVGQVGRYQEKLLVYGKEGKACPRCSYLIEKIRVAQRGTHYCPHCQPL
ncbi:DNA-formamidopyrimidine glycosylase [Aerococcaceae bacterium WGS1372]